MYVFRSRVIIALGATGLASMEAVGIVDPAALDSVLAFWSIPVLVMVVGLASLRRGHRQRRCLERARWTVVTCEAGELRWTGLRDLCLEWPDGSQTPARLYYTSGRRFGSSGLAAAERLEVAGDPEDFLVIRAPDHHELMSARLIPAC